MILHFSSSVQINMTKQECAIGATRLQPSTGKIKADSKRLYSELQMNVTDPSSLLETTLSSISNLQKETQFVLSEIRDSDQEFDTLRKFIETQDTLIQKHIIKNGAIQENPKENEIKAAIQEAFGKCKKLQERKNALANTLLYITTMKCKDLQNGMDILEADGVLAPNEIVEVEAPDSIKNILKQKYHQQLEDYESDSLYNSEYDDSDVSIATTKKRKANKAQKIANKNGSAGLKKSKQQAASVNKKHTKSASTEPHDLLADHTGTTAAGATNPGFSKTQNDEDEDDDKQLYCFCQNVSYGEMVACDGNDCKYEWFHYSCVNLTEPPKGKWYCPDCKSRMSKNLS